MSLLPDYNKLVQVVKKAAVDAVNASQPTGVVFGKVVSSSPLQIKTDQKLTLSMAQLVLSRNVTNFTVSMSVEHSTEKSLELLDLTHTHDYSGTSQEGGSDFHTHSYQGAAEQSNKKDLSHFHAYEGTKEFLINNGLKTGEDVIMMQMQGGQKFIVMDRVVI